MAMCFHVYKVNVLRGLFAQVCGCSDEIRIQVEKRFCQSGACGYGQRKCNISKDTTLALKWHIRVLSIITGLGKRQY